MHKIIARGSRHPQLEDPHEEDSDERAVDCHCDNCPMSSVHRGLRASFEFLNPTALRLEEECRQVLQNHH
jgi:hypothetical protein